MGAKNTKLLIPGGGGGEGGGGGGTDGAHPHPNNPSSSTHRPAPSIEAPYAGPWAEYKFVDVTVPVESDVTFSFSDVTMTSTNTSSVLSKLVEVYSHGYSLMTFCRVPSTGSGRRAFAAGKEVHYQGIFCRYEGDPGNEGWTLRVEKSLLQANHVTPGVVATEAGPGAQHVQQLISNTVQTGGRLLTVQWSGQPQQSSPDAALGVDVFFEVPDQPLPERSVYQLATAPATVLRRSLFTSKAHVTCDWAAILTRHLARGWRLVDIFCEAPSTGMSTPMSPASVKVQTVWFFEKPESRARDESAVYEGTIVEHWIDVISSSTSLISGSAAGCLGGGRPAAKKGSGGTFGKKNAAKRMASLRKKTEDDAQGGSDVKANDDVKSETKGGNPASPNPDTTTTNTTTTSETDTSHNASTDQDRNHFLGDHPRQTSLSQGQCGPDIAGWEGMIRSMGEKGWELASIINTMDSQMVSGRPKVKVLLVFQRRISLAMTVKGRRTSDGMALRADTGASTAAMCDIPMMMAGETTSHLNPSLAVRLPLSRSASRDHDDLNSTGYDDIPSTIGGSCSRTQSSTELSMTGRVIESGFLEPGRGSRRGRGRGGSGEEVLGLLQPKGSVDEGSIGTGGRDSPAGSQHSRLTAVEVHTPIGSGDVNVASTPTASEGKSIEKDCVDKKVSEQERNQDPANTSTNSDEANANSTPKAERCPLLPKDAVGRDISSGVANPETNLPVPDGESLAGAAASQES